MTDPTPDANCLAIAAATLARPTLGGRPDRERMAAAVADAHAMQAMAADLIEDADREEVHPAVERGILHPDEAPPTVTEWAVIRCGPQTVVAPPEVAWRVSKATEHVAFAIDGNRATVSIGDWHAEWTLPGVAPSPRFEPQRCRGAVVAEYAPVPSAVERRVDSLVDALRVVREHLLDDKSDDLKLHDIARTVNLDGLRDILDHHEPVAYTLTGLPEVTERSLAHALTVSGGSPTFLAERLFEGRRLSAEQAAHIHALVDACDTADEPREWVHRDVLVDSVEAARRLDNPDGVRAVLARYGREDKGHPLTEMVEVLGIERNRWARLADTLGDTCSAIRADLDEAVPDDVSDPSSWRIERIRRRFNPGAVSGAIADSRHAGAMLGAHPHERPSDEPPMPPCPNCLSNPCTDVGQGGEREWCVACKRAFAAGRIHAEFMDSDGRPQTVADWRAVIDRRRPLHFTVADIALGILWPDFSIGTDAGLPNAVVALLDRLAHSRSKWPAGEGGFEPAARRGILAAEVLEVVDAERRYEAATSEGGHVEGTFDRQAKAHDDLGEELLDVGAVALRWHIAHGGFDA